MVLVWPTQPIIHNISSPTSPFFYSSSNNNNNSFHYKQHLPHSISSLITMAPFTISLSTTLKPLYNNNINKKHFLISPLPCLYPQTLKPPSIIPIRFATTGNGSNPTTTTTTTTTTKSPPPSPKRNDRVQRVHNIQEFDNALRAAKDRLVVVEYATMEDEESRKIYPFMVDLSRTCNDVDFILVLGDESETTKQLCEREGITEVPHFSFYKSMQKIHDEAAVGPDMLEGDVLYYGDNHSGVVQLHSGEDVRKLLYEHRGDDKLVVLDVGLKHCGPCVKVYPTVVKLSKKMDSVIFARMNGDENESCMKFLKDMNVIEVPTFLFIRNGEIKGRYVGSGKGELIGEILRYQGVRVTY